MRSWTHSICEVCWFARNPDRVPVQLHSLGQISRCCFCGGQKITSIFVRHDPNDRLALWHCLGLHQEEQ